MTKYVQSRLLQKCRMRESVKLKSIHTQTHVSHDCYECGRVQEYEKYTDLFPYLLNKQEQVVNIQMHSLLNITLCIDSFLGSAILAVTVVKEANRNYNFRNYLIKFA